MEFASASTALGMAGNAYQFVQFVSKLSHMFLEIRNTGNGLTLSNADSEKRIKMFKRSLEHINANLNAYSPVLNGANKKSLLGAIMRRCKQISEDLLGKLQSLQLNGEKTVLRAFVSTVKALWGENEIRQLQDELQKFREELSWIIMLSMRSDMNQMKIQQNCLLKNSQHIITLAEFFCSRMEALPDFSILQTVQPSGHIQKTNVNSKNGNRQLVSQTSHRHQEASFDVYKAMAEAVSFQLAELNRQIFESLAFLVMRDTEKAISKAAGGTFNRIFRDSTSKSTLWSNFSNWLTTETSPGIYWINGKAGSGKSTLMKHLFQHGETRIALKKWANQSKFVLARFFFSFNGEDLQKSREGLLRTLLYACLKAHPELIPSVVPDYQNFSRNDYRSYWSLGRLQKAFRRLMSQKVVALKFCFFVDGLDEYAGDLAEITSMLKAMAKHDHVKICASSRPLPTFEKSLSRFPGLVLQHITGPAIRQFVRNNLNHNKDALRLEEQKPGWINKMVKYITSDASGVFIWVKLVVKSLLQGLGNNDEASDFRRRLEDLPKDLENMYWQMIRRVDPPWYLEEGFRLLLLVKAAGGSVDVLNLYFAETKVVGFAKKGPLSMEPASSVQEEDCRRLIERIKICCMGLLEANSSTGEVMTARVTFSHKTVSDFLNTKNAKKKIKEHLRGTHFIPEVKILRGILWRLKTHHTRQQTRANLKRREFFNNICPLVTEFVAMAQKAEALTRDPHTKLIRLIDELDRVVSALWANVALKSTPEQLGLIHWTVAPRKVGEFSQIGSSDELLSWTSALGSVRRTRQIDPNAVTRNNTGLPDGMGNHVDSKDFAYYAKEQGLRLYASAKGLRGH